MLIIGEGRADSVLVLFLSGVSCLTLRKNKPHWRYFFLIHNKKVVMVVVIRNGFKNY